LNGWQLAGRRIASLSAFMHAWAVRISHGRSPLQDASGQSPPKHFKGCGVRACTYATTARMARFVASRDTTSNIQYGFADASQTSRVRKPARCLQMSGHLQNDGRCYVLSIP
jgi:hypothetical protein